jgi:hypothetical protein
MLIKNEAEHLSRSLPKWAPLIDYWIVGIGEPPSAKSVFHPVQGPALDPLRVANPSARSFAQQDPPARPYAEGLAAVTFPALLSTDANNTDNSEEIIRKHLGHLPGETVVVEFDGMGPTWTILVERGLAAFPEATHGIIADADFTPTTCHPPLPEKLRCIRATAKICS